MADLTALETLGMCIAGICLVSLFGVICMAIFDDPKDSWMMKQMLDDCMWEDYRENYG